jgi:hypothetical protein
VRAVTTTDPLLEGANMLVRERRPSVLARNWSGRLLVGRSHRESSRGHGLHSTCIPALQPFHFAFGDMPCAWYSQLSVLNNASVLENQVFSELSIEAGQTQVGVEVEDSKIKTSWHIS